MEKIKLKLKTNKRNNDFSFYRIYKGIDYLAWDESCIEDLSLQCFEKDYNFGLRMSKYEM